VFKKGLFLVGIGFIAKLKNFFEKEHRGRRVAQLGGERKVRVRGNPDGGKSCSLMKEMSPARRFSLMRGMCLGWMAAAVLVGHAGEINDLNWLRTAACKEHLVTPRRVPADWKTRTAAVSLNQAWEKDRSKPWFVELQREGGRWVEAGIAHGDAACVGWGLRQLAWGFERMKNDGSFDCGDPFHSASFLVESTARSLLLLQASGQGQTHASTAGPLRSSLLTCARWMTSPVNEKPAAKQRIYGHRRFLLGCALLQTARLHGDSHLRDAARAMVRDGLALQRQDGAFPEKGGHDSSYHAVSLIYLQRYGWLEEDAGLRRDCDAAARRGVQWLRGRIDENGRVNVQGNTRTGQQQEVGRSGVIKQVNFPEVACALMMHAYRSGDESAAEMARKVLRERAVISR
jgi:hypothetical protein